MAKTNTVRLDTGKYLIKDTPWMAVCRQKEPPIWDLVEAGTGDVVLTTTSMRACLKEAERRVGAGLVAAKAPPAQPGPSTRVTICQDLAELLNTLKPARPGHRYVVLEVSDT